MRPEGEVSQGSGNPRDGHGHGTHVAGVIAGGGSGTYLKSGEEKTADFSGMAPAAELVVYKVLSDSGDGQDSWIIKALEHVADRNEDAGELVTISAWGGRLIRASTVAGTLRCARNCVGFGGKVWWCVWRRATRATLNCRPLTG